MPDPNIANVAGGLGGYLKKNAKFAYGGGLLGAAFLAGDVKGIFDADNKFKALLKTFKDFVLIRVAMVGVFTAIGAAVKSLVRDTGALDAALKKLSQMQVFSRQLQGLVGGLNTARKRVAELSQISGKGPFKFEEIVEANKNLEVFTRGAYSSVRATQEIGMAAIATGNSIEDTAKAVGVFYDQMRSGQPVEQTTEQMRQMGLISQTTTDHLNGMAAGGESVTNTFRVLQGALKDTAAAATGYDQELQTVTAEHEKAAEALKAGFAAPFTQNEVQNTQNMTAAMKAFTPTISTIGKSLAIVYTGFGTASSAIVKWIASSKLAQSTSRALVGIIEALSVAAVAFGTYAAVTLVPSILQVTAGLVGMGGAATLAGVALRGLMFAGVFGLVAAGIAGVVGMIINVQRATAAAAKAQKDWEQGHREATSAILAEAAAVKTLTERNEALAKSMARIALLQKEQMEDDKKQADDRKKRQKLEQYAPPEAGDPYAAKALEEQDRKQEELANRRKNIRTGEIQDLKNANDELSKENLTTKELAESEARRQSMILESTAGIEELERRAVGGLKERQRVANQNAESDKKIQEAQISVDRQREKIKTLEPGKGDLERANKQAKIARGEKTITQEMVNQQQVALSAEEGTSVRLEAEAERQRNARDVLKLEKDISEMQKRGATSQDLFEKRLSLTRAKALSGGEAFDPKKLIDLEARQRTAQRLEESAGTRDKRVASTQRLEIQTEIAGHQARRRGDIAGAQMQEDIGSFISNFKQLEPILGKQEAASVALAKTSDDIAQQYMDSQKIVSSMTAIGGGGGVSGVNPQLESDKRREQLQQEMVRLLAVLSGQETPEAQGTATFGR